jgi:hypothetical protein
MKAGGETWGIATVIRGPYAPTPDKAHETKVLSNN